MSLYKNRGTKLKNELRRNVVVEADRSLNKVRQDSCEPSLISYLFSLVLQHQKNIYSQL